ncbi:MAG: endonuclease/exonuclease/phosphatase family protein [Bacteroidota bacterium]
MKPKIVKVGNFNTYNLVLPEVSYYRRKYSQKTYQKKCRWIGEQLDRMGTDLVGLQEVFHPKAMQEALYHSNRLKQANLVVADPNEDLLPRVGLATNFPILEYSVIEAFPAGVDIEGTAIPIKRFSRPVLRALVELPLGHKVIVYVVHLKSKRPDFYEGEARSDHFALAKAQTRSLIRRAMEATALRGLLLEDLKKNDHPLILLGDVNDSGLAVTTRLLSGEPPHRKYPMDVKKEIWDVLLYQAKDIQARRSFEDYYFTHIHNGHHEALDHILVSQELVEENPNHIGRIGYVKVYNDHLVDETQSDDDLPAWESDHGQVVATLELDRRRRQDGKAPSDPV